ncbi:MAG: hypothetical protein F7C35_05865 [Desulfurococcales archaeon]|nr:hypothetical protein [Desulfurococcales archaeon]
MPKVSGIVDALWGLDLIAGRLEAVGVDYVLAGPVSMWLQGARGRVEKLYLLLVSNISYNREAVPRALTPLSVEMEWPEEYSAIKAGRLASVEIRGGLRVAAAADPVVSLGGVERRIVVKDLARRAPIAVLGGRTIRLAPIGVDLLLRGEVGEEG